MSVKKKPFVTFLSPGTFVNEETTKPIGSWDCKTAVEMAKKIEERHGATPYGFRFSAKMTADPIPDDHGGTLDVMPKTVKESGTYFLGGRLRTYDDVKKKNDPEERILRSNMLSNGWGVVIENTNSYRTTRPFEADDHIVDAETGEVTRAGKDDDLKAYREKFDRVRKSER